MNETNEINHLTEKYYNELLALSDAVTIFKKEQNTEAACLLSIQQNYKE